VVNEQHALAIRPVVLRDLFAPRVTFVAPQRLAAVVMTRTDAMVAHTLAQMPSGHVALCVEPASLIAMWRRRATARRTTVPATAFDQLATFVVRRLACAIQQRRAMVRQRSAAQMSFTPRGHVCRDKSGPCDVADLCPGGDTQCPPDAKEVVDTPCRPATGVCDVPELCNGSSKLCPADSLRQLSDSFVCRDASGDCDLREICDGSGSECPADKFAVGMTCRDSALGNTCDVSETCENRADCPANGFRPFNTDCDDGSELTNNDVCDERGVCSGKCLVNSACNDRNKCTEDTCSMETGRCLFTPVLGCTPDEPPPPPTNCAMDKSFRFDFLSKPSADPNSVVACFFKVSLTAVNGTSVVRTFAAGDAERAISFGIVPVGDDGSSMKDGKIRANTALVMRFPTPWTSAIESVKVSSVGADTVLAVVRQTPEEQHNNLMEALQAFDDSGGNRTVTKGVWLILKPGEQRAPPSIVVSPSSEWSVVHLRGQPFSLDIVTLTRPVDDHRVAWSAVSDGRLTPVDNSTLAPTPIDSTLIGAIVGGVIGGLVLLVGVFFLGSWWSRRRNRQNSSNDSEPALRDEPVAKPSKSKKPKPMQTEMSQLQADQEADGEPANQQKKPSHYQSTQGVQAQSPGYQQLELQPPPPGADPGYVSLGEFQSARGPRDYEELELDKARTPYVSGTVLSNESEEK
jgi:hypothetical protein